MQRVTSMLPSWDKTKTSSKKGFDKAWGWADKLGAPVNRLSNKIGSEAFWPTTLDKESDKAARILRSFCKDGFYAEEDRPSTVDVPKGKQRVLKKIPQKVMQNAVGLAIFTTMRTGLWVSGAGGSGVLIARKENGEWSPPSGILLHTAGLGFLVGVDIYDCVVVINNRKALDAFTKIRATLGGEISAVAGPVGVGGVLEHDGKYKQANRPVFTYLKSRGFYAGVQVDGTVIIERTDENERFYGERIGVADILAGKVRHPPYEIKMLMETVKAAEGRNDFDREMMEELEDQPAPGDVDVEEPTANGPIFGIPEPDDPDPFGVLALEKIGLEIREAGTKSRPPSSQFEYNPSPTSPVYGKFHRRSMDTLGPTSNRESYMSNWRTSTDRATQTTSMGTQTGEALSPATSPSLSNEKIVEESEKQNGVELEEIDYTKIDLGPYGNLTHADSDDFDGTTISNSPRGRDGTDTLTTSMEASYVTDTEDEDEPVIFEVFEAASTQATVMTPQAIKARGGLVTIPKRPPPPPLPPRNVARTSQVMVDQGSGRSPSKEGGFEEVDLHGIDRKSMELERRMSSESHHLSNGNSHDSEETMARKSIDSEHAINGTSTESAKDIVIEDLKEHDFNDSNSKKESSDEKIEPTLEKQHLDIDIPVVEESNGINGDASKHESKEMKDVVGTNGHLNLEERDEKDEFHSIPSTPNEIQAK